MKNKILKIAGLILLILISFAFASPYLFQGRILNHVKRSLNKDLRAHVTVSDLDISWFRHFPHMAIGLDHFELTGTGEFASDTLISARQVDLGIGLMSVLFGDSTKIYSVDLKEPQIHALIHKNGHDNWNIFKSSAVPAVYKTAFSRPFKLELQRYSIQNGLVFFTDESANRIAEIVNMNQEGKGDFAAEHFILKTKTTAEAVSFNNGGAMPWLTNARSTMEVSFKVDNLNHMYSFGDGDLTFNNLDLHTAGYFQWIDDSAFNVDVKFDVPSTDLKNMLSVVPALYNDDFNSISTGGSANFTGLIKGRYDNKHRPAYHVYLDVKNGSFQYSGLPKAVQNINVFIHIDNNDGLADHTTINIPRGHIELANDTLDFHFLLKNTGTETSIDAAAKGRIDFAKFSQWSKLNPGTKLKGLLIADAYVRETGSTTEKHDHDPFRAGGSLDLSNFSYTSSAHPGGIALDELLLTVHPENVMLNELKGEWQSTHFTADGAFKNLFSDLLKNKPVDGSMHIIADELSLNDWMNINQDASGKPVSGQMTLPFEVPRNVNMVIKADAGKVHFNNLDMENLSGTLQIADETIKFDNIKADALEGALVINGSYSTKLSPSRPDIHMAYDAKGLDIQKTFFAFNSIQKIMPIGKFISGKLSAQMTLNGKLGENMEPDLGTLSGQGSILLINGDMKDFGPLDKLAISLDIAQLKDISIKNINSDFSFKNNRVQMNSFVVNVNDIQLEIGGSHGFDQSLDYALHLKVPRKQLGSKGQEWVKNVVTQEANKGIPIQLGNDVNMNVVMTGTINSPLIQTDMNDMIDNAATDLKQEVDDFVKAKLDSARQQLRNPPAPPKVRNVVYVVSKNKYKSRKSNPQLAHNHLSKSKGKKKPKNTRKYYS
jgi:hypothetical protein